MNQLERLAIIHYLMDVHERTKMNREFSQIQQCDALGGVLNWLLNVDYEFLITPDRKQVHDCQEILEVQLLGQQTLYMNYHYQILLKQASREDRNCVNKQSVSCNVFHRFQWKLSLLFFSIYYVKMNMKFVVFSRIFIIGTYIEL